MRGAAKQTDYTRAALFRRLDGNRRVGVEAENGLVEQRDVSATLFPYAYCVARAKFIVQLDRLPLRVANALRLDRSLNRRRGCRRGIACGRRSRCLRPGAVNGERQRSRNRAAAQANKTAPQCCAERRLIHPHPPACTRTDSKKKSLPTSEVHSARHLETVSSHLRQS